MVTPTSSILSIADACEHLNIEMDSGDNHVIEAAIEAARRHVEAWLGPLDDFDPVPPDIVAALKLMVAHLYENREATSGGQGSVTVVPFGLHDLIGPYRRWEF